MVHKGNVGEIIPALGLPCVLGQPDKPFSMDVEKAQTQAHVHARVSALPEKSELVIAQDWLPAGSDRGVGVSSGACSSPAATTRRLDIGRSSGMASAAATVPQDLPSPAASASRRTKWYGPVGKRPT